MNHTTTNDLMLQYNLGFGKLVIEDYRVKDFRIQRAPYNPDFVEKDEMDIPKQAKSKRGSGAESARTSSREGDHRDYSPKSPPGVKSARAANRKDSSQ